MPYCRQVLYRGCLAIGLSATALVNACAAESTPEKLAHFESRIRPVLVKQCYGCHNSHDQAEGALALDHRDALRHGGMGGPIIVPGDPGASRLLAVLRHEIADLEMPQDGPQLPKRVIADFERWIADGAVDPRDHPPTVEQLAAATSWEQTLQRRKQWWSFLPIADPSPPMVDDARWAQHPIDQFVETRRAAAGLKAGDRATPRVLIRRLYFALTGLPPDRRAVESWSQRLNEADDRQRDAVLGELVDELLASPRFAERWARHWMDWIRYAESHGSEGDPEIVGAWHYRDYLIRAMQADVPVDQLLKEHVAGDLLATPRRNETLGINESAIGPAHWRMVFHGFAPTDALDEKVRFIDDQVNTFSKAFLGLTVSCARCHDHKFDAISQDDYYALFGVLGSCRPGRTAVDLPERFDRSRAELTQLKSEIHRIVADRWAVTTDDLAARILAAEKQWTDASQKGLFLPLSLMRDARANGQSPAEAWAQVTALASANSETQAAFDRATLYEADLSDPATYAQWFPIGAGLPAHPQTAGSFSVALEGEAAIQGIYPSGVSSHAISTKHPARLLSKDLELREPADLWVLATGADEARVRYVVQDYPRDGTVYRVNQLSDAWEWQRLDLSYWQGDQVHIEIAAAMDVPLLVRGEPRSWFAVREVRLVQPGVGAPADAGEAIGPILRLAAVHPPDSLESLAALYADAIREAAAAWQTGTINDEQALLLDASMRAGLLPNDTNLLPSVGPLVERYRQLEEQIPVATRVPGLDESTPRDQPLLIRGDHRQPGDPVPRRFLEAIDSTPYVDAGSGRLQLAADLLRDDNPLTRRVLVNRIWHHLFGQGIVRTPNNFGKMGDLPSHPELLDWLATRFVEQGWSLKQLIRELVLTETWQLSSLPPQSVAARDPDNRLLTYRSVQRLEAEAIRDLLLSLSGELVHETGGPPVEGSAPRRSIYVQVKRNALDPLLRTFDFPEPFTAVGRRSSTNVPAQALAMLNDPEVARWARSWAEKTLADLSIDDDEQRIAQMYYSAFSRPPSAEEVARCEEFLQKVRQRAGDQAASLAQATQHVATIEDALKRITQPVREQLSAADSTKFTALTSNLPEPIAHWNFLESADDQIGEADLRLHQGAVVASDGLLLHNGGYAVTDPLPVPIAEKTLSAWVQLAGGDQRGGGRDDAPDSRRRFFDAIVYGEQQPREWLAGSNNFARTKPFGGPVEREAAAQPVHLAIAYQADGQVVGYRNGKPYGKPFASSGPFHFEGGQTVVSFGVRHLPPTGNRLLSGWILEAQLYDRALEAAEIAAVADAGVAGATRQQIVELLSPEQLGQFEQLEGALAAAEEELQQLAGQGASAEPAASWTELALALATLKELIYVR